MDNDIRQLPGFSAALRKYRELSGLSQNALARRAGIDPSYVNRLERGERDAPARARVLDIARALELTSSQTNELLLSADYRPQTTESFVHSSDTLSADPAVRLLAEVFSNPRIPREEIHLLEQQIEMLKRRYSSYNQ